MLYDDGRIDWVTLFWTRTIGIDHLVVSPERELELVRGCRELATDGSDFNYKLSSGLSGKNAHHKIECWGETATFLARFMTTDDWLRVQRLDWRVELRPTPKKDWEAGIVGQLRRKGKRCNVSPYHTEPRKKTNKRDAGGDGVQFGSRHSNEHFVDYMRGDECPAFEYRLKDQTCKEMVEALVGQFRAAVEGELLMETLVGLNLASYARHFVAKKLGTADIQQHVDACIAEELGAQEVIEAMRANEKANRGGVDYWNFLAEDKPAETDAFEIVSSDERGLMLQPQVNIANGATLMNSTVTVGNSARPTFPDGEPNS